MRAIASAADVCPRSRRSSDSTWSAGAARAGITGAAATAWTRSSRAAGSTWSRSAQPQERERAAVLGALRGASRAWALIHSSGVRWADAGAAERARPRRGCRGSLGAWRSWGIVSALTRGTRRNPQDDAAQTVGEEPLRPRAGRVREEPLPGAGAPPGADGVRRVLGAGRGDLHHQRPRRRRGRPTTPPSATGPIASGQVPEGRRRARRR